MRTALPTETYCVVPWVHLYCTELGAIRPCCVAQEFARDADGRPFFIYEPDAVERCWNSPFQRKVRLDLLAGRTPKACDRCFRDEALGLRSYRQDSNANLGHHADAAAERTSADGSAPLDLVRSLDVRLGNECNLRCRMCSPISSKPMLNEWAEIMGMAPGDEFITTLRRLDWFSRDDLWRYLEGFVPALEKLSFAGGEPLIIEQMRKFLERVVEMGRAPHMFLNIVTNLTVLPQGIVALWRSFKHVDIVASVDAHGSLNSFIRYPSRWDAIDRNLRALDRDFCDVSEASITINTTVQVYNVLGLADLFEYTLSGFKKVNPYPRLTLLYTPECLDVRILTPALKALASERLRAFVDRWRERWPAWGHEAFTGSIDGLVRHMDSGTFLSALPLFQRYNSILDARRGQDVRSVVPELAALLGPPAGAAA